MRMVVEHWVNYMFTEWVISTPKMLIDNSFLENLDIGTSAEWISEHIGITSRRTVLPLDYIKHTRNQDPRAAREASRQAD